MTAQEKLKNNEIAIRAHDITVCLERNSVSDFEQLVILGMAVRLSYHLRSVPAVQYSIMRDVAVHLLDFPTTAVKPVLEFLAYAEFVKLDTQGRTIKTVIPTVPYYEKLLIDLGSCIQRDSLTEMEQLALTLVAKLSRSPMVQDSLYAIGAEKELVDRVVDIGVDGSFLIQRRTRGKTVLLSPTYFAESSDAYADLVAARGTSRVKRILELLKHNQGWPLSLIEKHGEIGGIKLNNDDLTVARLLAGEGFIPPPAIETSHAGTNFFLFGPRPGKARLIPEKRKIYESALALVAAVRQGQLLPARIAIKYPIALLNALKENRYLKPNTEAIEQYRQAALLGIGRLERKPSGWARFSLIDLPENLEAVDMALKIISGSEAQVAKHEEIELAFHKGHKYLESLIGRKRLIHEGVVSPDKETQETIDSFLLKER